MNERIKQLAIQAKDWAYADHDGYTAQMLFEQKFAELIVRECVDCLKPLSRNHSMVGAAQDTIKEHFGVEE